MFDTNGPDLDKLLRDAQERVTRTEVLREEMAKLTGQAEAADGRIRVSSTARDYVSELHIDPRAMRMTAEELATTIKETIAAARGDLDRQIQEMTAFQFKDAPNPLDAMRDKDQLKQTLGEVQGMFEKAGRDAQAMMDQLHRTLGITKQAPPR
ncbi:YbaB/EbfC family nucleoid-associated protein [Actinomadura fibrosa]|uniref:YbaB/EbfC family nucleoid-associated protein n=1 Tax=Actinomadura fibrosa TaxID=111802 RepID=A0ABW2XZL4_9ACTN|nr:YbaB/EbfC family nucleoid-associated protein [Actinomadura fibrosa]